MLCAPQRLVQNFTQPLHLIQEHVTLLHHGLILCVLERWACRLDDAVYAVDAGVQPSGRDEPGELAVEEAEQYGGCQSVDEQAQKTRGTHVSINSIVTPNARPKLSSVRLR